MGVGGNAAVATALATAAVRETWEETGVMIAAPGDVGPAPGATFDEMQRRGVAPALGRLVYLGRAITPARHPIRFHARFFLTLVGHGRGGLHGDDFGVDGAGNSGLGGVLAAAVSAVTIRAETASGAAARAVVVLAATASVTAAPAVTATMACLDAGDLGGDGELDRLSWVPLADVASLPTIDVTRFMAGFAGEIMDSVHPRSIGRPVFSMRGPHRLIRYL